jgi:hypothetical protein
MYDAMEAVRAGTEFDFLFGRWNIHNRRLREPMTGSDHWEEFAATSVARPLFDGRGNQDEFHTDHDGGMTGMSFRFFDADTGQWSIYWADSRRLGVLDPPVFGSFSGGIGIFEGEDTFAGRPVVVRFTWSRVLSPSPRWEQAFSPDGGETWELNWIMDFARAEEDWR